MLSLISAAAKAHLPRRARAPSALLRIRAVHPGPADRRALLGLISTAARSRAFHRSSRASSSAPVPAPSPSSAGDPSLPATDSTDSGSSSGNSSTVEAPSASNARQSPSASTASARRRLRSQRGAGKASGKTSSPSSGVYVPSIPQSFLATHHRPVSSNNHDIVALPYHVHDSILRELQSTMASCLLSPNSPQTYIQRMPARHNNIILSSPSEGSSQMLETLTMAAAKKIGADVLTVDMQDLMELTSDIFNKKGTGNPWPIDHLARGFNPFVAAPVPVEYTEDFLDAAAAGAGADDDADEDDDDDEREGSAILLDSRMFVTQAQNGQYMSASTNPVLKENFEKFWTALLLAEPAPQATREKSLPKVLYLKDIADILPSPFGHMLLPSLANAVLTLRKAGHNIMVVAGHSPSLLSLQRQYDDEVLNLPNGGDSVSSVDEGFPVLTPAANILQKQRWPDGYRQESHNYQYAHISLASLTFDTFPGSSQSYHHIAIPPFLPPAGAGSSDASDSVDRDLQLQKAEENARLLKQDKANRIKEINCRSLSTVLRFRGGLLSEGESPLAVFGSLAGVDSEVWGFGKVYRIISNALGSLYVGEVDQYGTVSRNATLSEKHIRDALETSVENVKLRKRISMQLNGKSTLLAMSTPKPLFNPEDYTRHERRMLGSIVDPEKIKTTFKNTIIPPETIQTLQTMITLPLVRPQLFSYGLLQNEFLSGLLLFGPPGTGKTLLAKAVAKESGARMLEIKASDIFDMYVGEGEKNVSAVFSLARKLSPCVVFLDEVDSIFRARGHGGGGGAGSGGGNSSQREILNQFMVEWDGLRSSGRNQGIVVMASTNRPFELDDAVLRRMPRRILVDLPSEQAREQILKVYLGQEQLEDCVDVKDLAKKTAFFSGSDLKNLCVSAALASVREDVENEVRSLQSAAGDSSSQQAGAASDDKDSKPQGTVMDLSLLLNQYKKEALSRASSSSASTLEGSAASVSSTPVRVIKKRHFEKALAQITPSCSENMDSLTELRKWDGLYGDGGKGRRKVNKGIGFEVEHSPSTSPVGSSAEKARR